MHMIAHAYCYKAVDLVIMHRRLLSLAVTTSTSADLVGKIANQIMQNCAKTDLKHELKSNGHPFKMKSNQHFCASAPCDKR